MVRRAQRLLRPIPANFCHPDSVKRCTWRTLPPTPARATKGHAAKGRNEVYTSFKLPRAVGVPGTGPSFSYDPEQHRSKQNAPDAATIYRLDLLRYPPEHDGHVRPVSINGITAAVSRERSANRVDALE